MKNKIRNRVINLIGIYQIIAGLIGLSLIFKEHFLFILQHLLTFTLIFGLFTFSVISGIYLLKRQNFSKGINLSLINQGLQLMQFEVLGNGLYYVAGFYLALGFSDTPHFHLDVSYYFFRSACYISFFVDSNEITLTLNFVALSILVALCYFNNQLRNDK